MASTVPDGLRRGVRVLVVEDEALVSIMMEDCLEQLGCIIVARASRLAEAMQKAATETLDIAVLDVNLNGEMSYPVAELLMARHIPFIFATGYGHQGMPDRLREACVLAKPFRIDQLAEALASATVIQPEPAPKP